VTNVIAHRGASARFPENSIEAFEGAVALGADGVELDVRRTSDGKGVVHHDAELADGRSILSLALEEVPVTVARLDDALDACGGLLVNVEIKNWRADTDFDPTRRLVDWTLDRIGAWGHGDRVVVSSFDLGTIDRVRHIDPTLRTAWLVVDRGDPVELIARAAGAGHDGIHPMDRMVDASLVDAAHRHGLFVNVWTVDDPERIRQLADVGVDGVVTNVPDVARSALDGSA
jgi:glycerophosphoryl diester phosphodiesterase